MNSEATPSPANKIIKPELSVYGLLLSIALATFLILFSESLSVGIYKSLGLALMALVFVTHYSLLIGLTFESFRRYSRFGISHTKNFLNHALSILLAVLPFAAIFISILVLPALLLMAASKYRSPDAVQPGVPFYKNDGIFELLSAPLWLLMNLCFYLATGRIV